MESKKPLTWLVFLFPIINAVATNTTDYFPPSLLNPGTVRAIIIGLFLIYFIIYKYPNDRLSRLFLFYCLFYLILSLTASRILTSTYNSLKFIIATMALPVGYYYINSIKKLNILLKILIITLALHMVNILIANIFTLGSSDYLDETFYFGAGRVNVTKSILILIFMLPLVLMFVRKYRSLVIVLYTIAFFVTLIGIKRSVMISAGVGIVTYLLAMRRGTLLFKSVMAIMITAFVVLLIFPNVVSLFKSRFEARKDRVELTEETFDTEARVGEIKTVLDGWKNGSVKHKLIGSEPFNDRYYLGTFRMLHTDYMIILSGSGLIGLLLWFYMYWLIVREKNRYYRFLKNHVFFREMNAVFWGIMAAQLILSVAGTVYAIEARSLIFLYWGAFLGTMRGYLKAGYLHKITTLTADKTESKK